mgnify:CR=1 FL=1
MAMRGTQRPFDQRPLDRRAHRRDDRGPPEAHRVREGLGAMRTMDEIQQASRKADARTRVFPVAMATMRDVLPPHRVPGAVAMLIAIEKTVVEGAGAAGLAAVLACGPGGPCWGPGPGA